MCYWTVFLLSGTGKQIYSTVYMFVLINKGRVKEEIGRDTESPTLLEIWASMLIFAFGE